MGYGGGGSAPCWNNSQGSGNLTEEQRTQLDKLSQKFYDDTAQLKNEIWAKSAELNTLLNSSNPDADKAKALQKEISELRSKFAQARITFELETRKINPDQQFGRGYGKGYGRHKGRGGPGMGYGQQMGGYGPGACWN